jgi:hypothetical protein
LVFSPSSVRVAQCVVDFPDVLEVEIRLLEGFPGASNEPAILDVFSGTKRVAYHRVVGDLLATREAIASMTEEEKAHSIAKAEAARQTNKRGEVKQLQEIDFSHWKADEEEVEPDVDRT